MGKKREIAEGVTAKSPEHISFYLKGGPAKFQLLSMTDLPDIGTGEDHVAVLLKDVAKETQIEGTVTLTEEVKEECQKALGDKSEDACYVILSPVGWLVNGGTRIATMTMAAPEQDGELTRSAQERADA